MELAAKQEERLTQITVSYRIVVVGGEYEIDDDRDRNYGIDKPEPTPEPKYGVPVGYFYKFEGRWQIAFWGEMPENRIVQVWSGSSKEWKLASLATQATATVRYRGDAKVPVYGFNIKRIINL